MLGLSIQVEAKQKRRHDATRISTSQQAPHKQGAGEIKTQFKQPPWHWPWPSPSHCPSRPGAQRLLPVLGKPAPNHHCDGVPAREDARAISIQKATDKCKLKPKLCQATRWEHKPQQRHALYLPRPTTITNDLNMSSPTFHFAMSQLIAFLALPIHCNLPTLVNHYRRLPPAPTVAEQHYTPTTALPDFTIHHRSMNVNAYVQRFNSRLIGVDKRHLFHSIDH